MKGKSKYLILHILLLVYSFCGVFSKLASGYEFPSTLFVVFYGISLGLLGIYAIFWQQILKYFSLTEAFFNKAVIVVWGMVWGVLFFREGITLNMIIGAVIIIVGIGILSGEKR